MYSSNTSENAFKKNKEGFKFMGVKVREQFDFF